MSLRYHEVAESDIRILNPFSLRKLLDVGRVAGLRSGMRVLDLACGKGEMLCQWSQHFGVTGIGVDHSKIFLAAARSRAEELEVQDRITFVEADAGKYAISPKSYDAVCCIGATWIRENLDGTLRFMRIGLKPGGMAIVGEAFWRQLPLPEEYRRTLTETDVKMGFRDLAGTSKRVEESGMGVIGMILANEDDWDTYETAHWKSIEQWSAENAKHADAKEFHGIMRRDRETYLRWGRTYMGWGVFITKLKET